jgi:riboflavin kinase, archaea type
MEIETLKRLAMLGAMDKQLSLSSSKLASDISASTQTAARRLSALEDEGYITRIVTSEGQKVEITDKGILRLMTELSDYQRIFGGSHTRSIKGKVTSGLGEGQYYISLDGYREQFNQRLGFNPYPGTLNLKLSEPFAEREASSSIEVEGFKDLSRTFGGCRCYPVKIKGIMGAIIRPDRSSYPPRLVEIIAPVNLRKSLGLYDGDELEVTLE